MMTSSAQKLKSASSHVMRGWGYG